MPDPLIALLIAAVITALSLLFFFPERGLYWRWQRARELTDRVLREDALKHICQSEIHGGKSTVQSLAGALNVSPNQVAQVLGSLQTRELLELRGSDFNLTPAGRDYALRIIRAHRLYERYLAEETGFSEAEWHDQAHRYEHQLTPDEIESLSARLGNPTYDPHGDPIPTSSGDVVYQQDRIPITALEVGKPARIVHLEDEPEVVYSQLVAEGLYVGQVVRLLEVSTQRIRLWGANDEHVLAPLVAANISVVPIPQELEQQAPPGKPLSTLRPGQKAQVVSLLPGIRGSERRRLMDLGLLPGTLVSAEMVSAGGDPTAYRIRGALIALRKTQSDLIYVCPEGDECLA
jgi:DtxR family transcriptional regulator, Mn-dependent transcriptional regulator